MSIINVNKDWCKRCGICVEFCSAEVFSQEADGTPVPVSQDKCTVCRLCELRCPDFAIKVEVGEYESK